MSAQTVFLCFVFVAITQVAVLHGQSIDQLQTKVQALEVATKQLCYHAEDLNYDKDQERPYPLGKYLPPVCSK